MIRDRIVTGCTSEKCREKLIYEGDKLTMDKAIQIVQPETVIDDDVIWSYWDQRRRYTQRYTPTFHWRCSTKDDTDEQR